MDFSFDDEQQLFKRSARKFLETYCDKSVVEELEDSESGFSPELWKGMAELGWMAVVIPSEYDGLEQSLLELAVLFEEMGRAAVPGPFLGTVMVTLGLLEAGTEEQKKSYLSRIAGGELVLTMAVEEPEVSYDPTMIATRAGSRSLPIRPSQQRCFVASNSDLMSRARCSIRLFRKICADV